MRVNGAKVEKPTDDHILNELKINGGGPKANKEVIENLRSNAKIPSSAGTWEEIDEEVIRAYEEEAKLVQDIRGQGLTANHDIGNLFSSYRISSLMNDAEVDMSGETMGEEDRVDYITRTVPVPVIHKEFKIGWREDANTDTSQDNIAEATRAVSRALETMAWGGTSFTVEGNAINGLKDTNTSGDWGSFGAWTSSAGLENAYQETIDAIETLNNNGFSSPYNLYVDDTYMSQLMGLRTNTTQNYVDIIESLPQINAVRFTNNISGTDTAYLVSMSRRAIDIANAQWITPVNWEKGPNGRVTQFSVFAVAVPRMKKDYQGNHGVNKNDNIAG